MSIEPRGTAPPAPQPSPPTVQRFPQPQEPGPVQGGPIPVRVTNAFSVGFYAFWGAFLASIVIWIIAFIVLAACGGILAGALRSGQ